MKVSVYTCSVSRRAGGLFDTVRDLYLSSVFQETDIKIYSYEDYATQLDLPTWKNIPIQLFASKPFLYSRQARDTILLSKADILHVHGLWRYPHAFIDTWKRYTGLPTVATIQGMLDPYIIEQQGKIKQYLGKWLFANRGFNAVTCFHALSMKEFEDIRAYGLKQPVAVIPNCINLPDKSITYAKQDVKKHLLYLGRLHRKKGIDLLLEAVASIKMEYPDILEEWVIDIVGWDHEGFLKSLRNLVSRYQLEQLVTFHGGLFGNDKKRMYANANAYILPTHSEGMPMTVLEAWSYCLPVVMTPYCNIPEGFKYNAAIQIDNTVVSVKKGLLQLFNMTDEERMQIGRNGRRLVEKQFIWDVSAEKMRRLYEWIHYKGEMPEFVYI
ncbi:MAG: glycosyltransferase [Bacteroidales bacterium]|jgi:poly(glycerol-phosphate) alpha-glucosyltransferase|nr:glycosyltransferase [Bacteroidales bacterium]